MPDENYTTLNVENFPLAVRRRMKSIAAAKGMHLKDAVIEACDRWCTTEEVAKAIEPYEHIHVSAQDSHSPRRR